MSRYERFAMILDPGGGELGVAALGLIAGGIDALYASDLDEALLQFSEQQRVGALVLPGTLPLARIDDALARIAPRLRAGKAAVVIVAPPRERALLRGLRDRHIRWVLHPPYDAAELRFCVVAALSADDDLDPRVGLRIPVRLRAVVRFGGTEREGRLLNLSLRGAYAALTMPPPIGSAVALDLAIGDRRLHVDARVVHRRTAPQPRCGDAEPGCGLAFRPLAHGEQRLVECFIRDRVDSFRL